MLNAPSPTTTIALASAVMAGAVAVAVSTAAYRTPAPATQMLTSALGVVGADAVLELEWDMLRPKDAGSLLDRLAEAGLSEPAFRDQRLGGVVLRGAGPLESADAGKRLVPELAGKTVRMPGYVVPVVYGPAGATEFLLVPFIGAEAGAPSAPANQTVLVRSARPYAASGIYDAVLVTGVLGLAGARTGDAAIGYALEASRIDPYPEGWAGGAAQGLAPTPQN